MKRSFLVVQLAAAFVFAMVLGASAQVQQTPFSNITITQCNPHIHPAGVSHPWIDPYGFVHQIDDFPFSEAFLAVTYTNMAAQPATAVDFGLVSRGDLIAVAHDTGTFSPGAVINHEFVINRQIFPRILPDPSGNNAPACAVLKVTYADGSVWRNPAPPL
jgi:hypothetical protein